MGLPSGSPFSLEEGIMEKTLSLKKDEPAEEVKPATESLHIDLAPGQGAAINYGGFQFVHGATYNLPIPVAAGVKEVMNRGWAHEASLADRTDYTKNKRVGGRAYV